MGFLTAPEDALIEAVAAGQTQLRLNHCFGSLDAVFKNALQKEPRLLAFLAGYSSTYQKKGLVQLCFDYDVTLCYQEPRPASLGEVAVDTGVWDPAPLLRRGLPREETLVTQDPADVSRKLSALLGRLLSEYEGIHGWRTGVSSFGKLSPYAVCTVSYDYLLPLPQLRQLQGKARFAAKQIWRSILGRATVPRFVKPFLALSYLSQECGYDQRAFDEAAGASDAEPSDPIPHLAYGPLVEKRGICSGLAWAFKTLMDEANIECRCVSGALKDAPETGHQWNLVRLDGQLYHVDPTWGIREEGVFVGGLLQPDSMMRGTHLWNAGDYPAARGMHFGYDLIESYLAENGSEFLDAGADERIFFPDRIVE